MCGRYANDLPLELIARAFRARNNIGDFGPRYNAAPTQMLPVVRWNAEAGERSLDLLRWGLIPSWAKEPSIGNKMINARAETIATTRATASRGATRSTVEPARATLEIGFSVVIRFGLLQLSGPTHHQ